MTYRPWVNRKFGVELEMNDVTVDHAALSSGDLRRAVEGGLVAAGVSPNRLNRAAAGYYHSNGLTWDVKTDASCGYNGRNGWEIASPAMMLDEDGECAELREVCERVRALRPRVDRSCGLHVHVEVRDFDWQDLRNLIILFARYEPFLFELCPPSRRTNTFCPPMRKADWAATDSHYWTRVDSALRETREERFQSAVTAIGRYVSLNLSPFWRSRRIEFRLGAGTVQYEKIVRWTQLLLSMVQRAKNDRMPKIVLGGWANQPLSANYFCKMVGLTPSQHVPEVPEASAKLVEWVRRRQRQFRRGDGDAIDAAVSRGAYADTGRGL